MIKRILATVLIALLCLSFAGCTAAPPAEQLLWHMDTAITVRLYGEREATQDALDACDKLLDALDSTLSSTDEQSPIFHFNASPDGRDVALSEEVRYLIQTAIDLCAITDGAFDITTASLTALWQACEQSGTFPTEEQLSAARSLIGNSHLSLEDEVLVKDIPGTRIDLGGIGKGYAADRLIDLLRTTEGVTAALISFGSNVAVLGEKPDGSPWRIALRDPNNVTATLGHILLSEEKILSVSGDYERYFTFDGQTVGHILDPATGYPPENGLRSVAVLCSDGTTADALSTAFMVMGEQAARALYESGALSFEAVFVYDDRVSCTPAITLSP